MHFRIKKFNFISIFMLICLLSSMMFTSCDEDSLPAEPLAIGQFHEGGLIVFLDDSGEHGVIAATTDQHTSIKWCLGACQNTNALATAPGSGKSNTNLIVSVQKNGNYAAAICDQLVHNGFDDWYLPAKDELNFIFKQKQAGTIGNFLEDEYWSSTESQADRAWNQHLGNGSTTNEVKETLACIRAVRSF